MPFFSLLLHFAPLFNFCNVFDFDFDFKEEFPTKRFSLEPHETYLVLTNLRTKQAYRFYSETEAILFAASEGGRVVYSLHPAKTPHRKGAEA